MFRVQGSHIFCFDQTFFFYLYRLVHRNMNNYRLQISGTSINEAGETDWVGLLESINEEL